MKLMRALVDWLVTWARQIGHEHRYTRDGLEGITTPFCLICGKYR